MHDISEGKKYPVEPSPPSKTLDDLTKYLPLHKAILEDNLESVKNSVMGINML
ncbi:hypothetical protein Pint_11937 [Pistacia integerrima]|uniref:Uncharacterized protein n=1 Tax=Pistacia integerrima TaxID=434235 RepID=A0ACC0XKS4_9ROSI|nr:hypothetical protein Pint_11937 [Pistacia integerrima]